MRKTLILLFLIKPKSMDAFLADYVRTTKEDIQGSERKPSPFDQVNGLDE
jgi:hypothetical protein